MKFTLTFEEFINHLETNIHKIDTIREFEVNNQIVRVLLSYKNKQEPENIKIVY